MILREFTVTLFNQYTQERKELFFCAKSSDYRDAFIEAVDFGIKAEDERNERDYDSKRFYWCVESIKPHLA